MQYLKLPVINILVFIYCGSIAYALLVLNNNDAKLDFLDITNCNISSSISEKIWNPQPVRYVETRKIQKEKRRLLHANAFTHRCAMNATTT